MAVAEDMARYFALSSPICRDDCQSGCFRNEAVNYGCLRKQADYFYLLT
jgi:hypothetical protein